MKSREISEHLQAYARKLDRLRIVGIPETAVHEGVEIPPNWELDQETRFFVPTMALAPTAPD